MNVLSLFDGISTCHLALEKAGLTVDRYYSTEIDKYAIQIASKNYPQDDKYRLGDVTKWKSWDIDWSSIDLVTGGFPCQAWSVAGKQLGDRDERGMLFWTTLDIIKNVMKHNPKAKFLMENVKMKKEFEEYITHHTTEALGLIHKHLINSALVSAQNRQRYYWTNIEGIRQPRDKGILLRDVLEDDQTEVRPCELKSFKDQSVCHHIATATDIKGNESLKRVYADTGKAPTLTTMTGGHREPKVLINKLGNVNPSGNGINGNVYGVNAKSPTLTTNKGEGIKISTTGHSYRKLTPLECERLQTLPDNFTEGVSNSQRYKMLGNGWTCDVIVHIFKALRRSIR